MGWTVWNSIPAEEKDFFSFPKYPNRFHGPPSLLCNGYWGSLLRLSARE